MNTDDANSSRRNFIKQTGAAVGAGAIAAAIGGNNTVHAHEINAMQPTSEQFQAFLATDFGGPVVMVCPSQIFVRIDIIELTASAR